MPLITNDYHIFRTFIAMGAEFWRFIDTVSTFQLVVKGFICFVGGAVSMWVFATILLNTGLRGHLRNQLICNLFIVYLLNSGDKIPELLDKRYRSHLASCYEESKTAATDFLEDNVENLVLIILLVAYVAQILSLDLRPKLGPRKTQIGVAALLIGPWCIALLLALANIPADNKEIHYLSIFRFFCLRIEFYRATNIIDIVLLSIAVLLLFLAVALKYSRFAGCCSDNGHSEPQYQGTNIDPAKVYIVAVVLLVVFQLPYHIVPLLGEEFSNIRDTRTMGFLWISFELLNDFRHVVMPLVWILLPDIRQRIKNWMPRCYCSKSADLSPLECNSEAEV